MKPLPLLVFALATAGLVGCASKQAPAPSAPAAPKAEPLATPAAPAPASQRLSTSQRPTNSQAAKPGPRLPSEVRTRNAMFKLASYDELPGWQQDDMRASWSAFRNSCEVLQKRDDWRQICADSQTVPPNTRAMRSFFESRFTLLRILNTDATREGDVTGYFEPLLEGQPHRDAEFNTPVMGTPRDLYIIDWARVPKALRRSVVRVKPDGKLLLVAALGDTATYALDMRSFVLDTRDRRLRVRLVGDAGAPNARVEPYYTRAELDALGLPQGINAPVVTWVNDPLALYAMQVQGSGRVRLPSGQILRLQYAEQNGHPFKPLRVTPKASVRVATRGLGDAAGTASMSEAADEFEIEGDVPADAEQTTPVLTRGGGVVQKAPAKPAVDPLVEELLKGARKPVAGSAAGANANANANAKRPTTAVTPPAKPSVAGRLSSDPSYVFFKTVADRPHTEGPQGALGVPLTPGRSVAVDPRVTPLGYPVFLSAPAPAGSSISMQRLVFAQDTGGAIRGAVRADYFWGFGNEAGQMARSTRHRGQMWVLLPTAEAARLATSKLVTRGLAVPGSDAENSCLVPDGEFCDEVD